jgi:hypothetical protein
MENQYLMNEIAWRSRQVDNSYFEEITFQEHLDLTREDVRKFGAVLAPIYTKSENLNINGLSKEIRKPKKWKVFPNPTERKPRWLVIYSYSPSHNKEN